MDVVVAISRYWSGVSWLNFLMPCWYNLNNYNILAIWIVIMCVVNVEFVKNDCLIRFYYFYEQLNIEIAKYKYQSVVKINTISIEIKLV